jgi:hypothetical protein
MDEFIGDRLKLEEACRVGFLAVQDHWHATIPVVLDKLGHYELKVWFAIHSRTIKFGKLFEKIPGRHFKYGLRNDDDTLKFGERGYPIFPPVIADPSNLRRTINSLIKKRAISRFESQKHSQHGVAYIYTPINAVDLLNVFLQSAKLAYVGKDRFLERYDWPSFMRLLSEKCGPLLDEMGGETKRVAAPAQKLPADAREAVTTSNAQGDGSRPPVRKRVRSTVNSAGG